MWISLHHDASFLSAPWARGIGLALGIGWLVACDVAPEHQGSNRTLEREDPGAEDIDALLAEEAEDDSPVVELVLANTRSVARYAAGRDIEVELVDGESSDVLASARWSAEARSFTVLIGAHESVLAYEREMDLGTANALLYTTWEEWGRGMDDLVDVPDVAEMGTCYDWGGDCAVWPGVNCTAKCKEQGYATGYMECVGGNPDRNKCCCSGGGGELE